MNFFAGFDDFMSHFQRFEVTSIHGSLKYRFIIKSCKIFANLYFIF